jgi:hypothetical protein
MKSAPFTVVTFFAPDCPCQRAHDARLAQYFATFSRRGVAFYGVDANAASSLAIDEAAARERRYVYPILSNPDGRLADALSVRYATETVIVDATGRVRYRGGIDADCQDLHDDNQWLRDALAALLDGREPPANDTKSLGCALRRR